jgi:hypothetical protein
MKNAAMALGAVFGALGLVAIVMVIMGFPAMWLWNWLMPSIFGLTKINFWQAIGLQLLAYIILPTPKINNKSSNK